MSGIKDETFHNVVWYNRTIKPTSNGNNTVVHFEGGDYFTKLRVNGQFAGAHKGGYTRFSFDITHLLLEGGNVLTVRVEVRFEDKLVNRIALPVMRQRGRAKLDVRSFAAEEWLIKTWSPEQPNLYDIHFKRMRDACSVDEVASYFGMREISIRGDTIVLNDRPLYQRLILDQGYWKDSHLTPPDESAIVRDIDSIMAMGYNGVRKHQKIEDERFAFWCDVEGLLMWCESPSAYEFGDDAVRVFTEQWLKIMEQHYNHPCIITCTPFNESWEVRDIKAEKMQQHFTESIYYLTKSVDAMRPCIVNDGWEHTVSDIITLHDYEELGDIFMSRYAENKNEILANKVFHNNHKSAFAEGDAYNGRPIILSEYGGAAYAGGTQGAWGHGNTAETEAQLLKRIDDMTTAMKRLPWVCGYCYTQVTDVRQEINGLMDIDRNFKADCGKLYEINLKKVGVCY